eukprot:12325739-Karenia_brevis.AAC.1
MPQLGQWPRPDNYPGGAIPIVHITQEYDNRPTADGKLEATVSLGPFGPSEDHSGEFEDVENHLEELIEDDGVQTHDEEEGQEPQPAGVHAEVA